MREKAKYPRTPHLPWSPGSTADDILLDSIEALSLMDEVVVTEKLDGENTTLHRDYAHARSPNSGYHPSRSWVSMLHGSIGHLIPEKMKVCGENVFARHSIHYGSLESYFYVFAVIEGDTVLSWDDTVDVIESLDLVRAPLLYRGIWDIDKIKSCWTGISRCGGEQEGYVVRNAGRFELDNFQDNIAKYVRSGHVASETHWMKGPVVRNRLKAGSDK